MFFRCYSRLFRNKYSALLFSFSCLYNVQVKAESIAENPYLSKLNAVQTILKKEHNTLVSPIDSDTNPYFRIIRDERELIDERLSLIHNQLTASNHHCKSPKKLIKGINDPNYPGKVIIKPTLFLLPEPLCSHFDQVNLEKTPDEYCYIKSKDITPKLLNRLPYDDLDLLLAQLSQINVKIKWYNNKNRLRTRKKIFGIPLPGWEKTNAAAAFALTVGLVQEKELLVKMLSLAPNAITFGLKRETAAIIDAQLAAKALVTIISHITTNNSRQIASSAENIAQVYVDYWAEKQSDRLILALTHLVIETIKIMNTQETPFTSKQKGILLGVLLAGTLLHANQIKSKDERRLWIVNSLSNLAWATSTFMGVIPIAGSIASAVAGSLSVAVVTWDIICNKIGVRDFTPAIREIEGHIEFSALEAAEKKEGRGNMHEALETLAWMRGTIHINGLSD